MSRKKNSNKIKKKIKEIVIFLIIICILGILQNFGIIQIDEVNSFFDSTLSNISEIDSNTEDTISIETTNIDGENVKIYFIDVGQADCSLLVSNNETMLIDAGNNEDGKYIVDFIKSLGINKIDYVIGTHAHEDHIGGLDNVIREFEIENVLLSPVTSNTQTYEGVLEEIEKKNLGITVPKIGEKFKVGNTVSTVLSVSDDENETNNSSIVVRTEFYNNSFLFMADLESNYEKKIKWPETTVLKVGHHGAETSSCNYFLNQVKPKYSIISVGEDNSYNHPSSITLNRLRNIKSEVYRTDEKGTVVLTSDGNKVDFEFHKTNTNCEK